MASAVIQAAWSTKFEEGLWKVPKAGSAMQSRVRLGLLSKSAHQMVYYLEQKKSFLINEVID